MPEKNLFINKLLTYLDKLDKHEIKKFICDLAAENQFYADVIAKLPIGVLITGESGEILLSNGQSQSWLDLPVNSSKPLSIERVADAAMQACLASHTGSHAEELTEDVRVLAPREMVLRVQSFKVNLSGGSDESRCLVLLRDVTGHALREDTKNRLSNQEALLRLASGVAHEVGNPLNAIQIHLALLKEEIQKSNSDKQKQMEEKISVIQSETTRLDKIIRSFLKATRKPPLRFKHEDLNALLRGVIHVIEPELASNQIELVFEKDENLPEFLMDKERIHEIFFNLIKNASEAMPAGGEVKVSISHKDKVALVKVKDSGLGISDEHLPHIFDAYYTTKHEGSGLGLMTVYSAIMEHGGRIEVETKRGKSTTFIVLLPIRKPKKQLADFSK